MTALATRAPIPILRGLRGKATAVLLLAAVALTGCSSSTTHTTARPGSTPPEGAAATFSGKVLVLAAASLTESFGALQEDLRTRSPDASVTFSFGGSGALVEQVLAGAPADLIATADTTSMQRLVDAGRVDTPRPIATNRLEILVAPGNPKHIRTVADLARNDLVVVLCDTNVPAGRYARTILDRAKVTVAPRSLEADVKAAVTKVTLGEADATIVYATDVRAAGAKGQGVAIPEHENLRATYVAAVVRGAPNHVGATAVLDEITSPGGQATLGRFGFGPADPNSTPPTSAATPAKE